MPNGQPAQIANLKPWQAGNTARRRSRDVDRAITRMRQWSPLAVKCCVKVIQDENEPTALRLKAAIAIIDKAIPNAGASAAWNMDSEGGTPLLRISFVDAVDATTVTIQTPTVAAKTPINSRGRDDDDRLQLSFDRDQ
jgi:hypothetical protein